jgi:glycosyltransferase involved in cell wall biosynthesis
MTVEAQVKMPKVSICIPVYNGELFIGEAIDSVLRQDYDDIEIIVNDNASTDKTRDIVRSYISFYPDKIRLYENEINIGMANNWNKVINKAVGDYIILLSADDKIEPGMILRCMAVMDESVDAVSVNHLILEHNNLRRRRVKIKSGDYKNCVSLIMMKNPFSVNFTIFNRSRVCKKIECRDFFSVPYQTCDYDLWLRLAISGATIRYMDEPLGMYRVHDANLSHKKRKMRRQTSLVIFRHSDVLREKAWFVYKLTLARFLTRVIYDVMRGDRFDYRHFKVLLQRLIWK